MYVRNIQYLSSVTLANHFARIPTETARGYDKRHTSPGDTGQNV